MSPELAHDTREIESIALVQNHWSRVKSKSILGLSSKVTISMLVSLSLGCFYSRGRLVPRWNWAAQQEMNDGSY